MSKSNVERTLRNVEDVLDMISRKLQQNSDSELKSLGREASDAKRELRQAAKEMHSHWED